MHSGSRGRAASITVSTGPIASMPSGLGTSPLSSNVPGPNTKDTVSRPMVIPETHATGRHRRDGRCPSGNSNSRYVPVMPITGTQRKPVRAATTSAAGSEPGCSTSPYSVYGSATEPTPMPRPTASRSQAMRLSGWRRAIRIPVTGNARKTMLKAKPSTLVASSIKAFMGKLAASMPAVTAKTTHAKIRLTLTEAITRPHSVRAAIAAPSWAGGCHVRLRSGPTAPRRGRPPRAAFS